MDFVGPRGCMVNYVCDYREAVEMKRRRIYGKGKEYEREGGLKCS